jgi:fucose permease
MVNTKGFTAADAAGYLVLYFLGLTVGRILSGLLSDKLSTWTLLKIGICFGAIGCIAVFFACEPIVTMVGLFFIGCGVAPVFPGLVFLTPRNFGVDVSQSVTGFELSFAYTGMMVSPIIFGFFASAFTTYAFPAFVLFFEIMMAICNIALVRSLKKQGKACQ